jgi:hypothetical protein
MQIMIVKTIKLINLYNIKEICKINAICILTALIARLLNAFGHIIKILIKMVIVKVGVLKSLMIIHFSIWQYVKIH